MKGIRKTSYMVFLLLSVLTLSCLDPYEPPVSKNETNFMVIDGNINSTDNVGTVKLSRSISLSDTIQYPAEAGATVFIENESGQLTLLPEASPGLYSANSSFDQSQRYRLRITSKSKKYLSDFISLQKNSPIDSLGWKADGEKLEVYASTHDFTEGIKYYRYNYEETHEYRSAFFSSYIFENGGYQYRLAEEEIHRCWISFPSSNILVASTNGLAENSIINFPVRRVAKGDRKLWNQYSLLVKQFAISKEAFIYWTQIKNLSESLGGLFDPLPYQIKGNIFSETDPNEVVLGYFSGGEVTEKRVVIRGIQLPNGFQGFYNGNCTEYYIEIGNLNTLVNSNAMLTLAKYEGISLVGFFYSFPSCVDCRLEGGTNVKPDFMF